MKKFFSLWMALSLLITLSAVPCATAGVVNYIYDDAGRLVAADYGNGKWITWTYDKNGNLLERTVTSSATPIPDIRVNYSNGPLTVSNTTPVSVTVGLIPGAQTGQTADWWVAASTPSGWYTFVYPSGWQAGIHPCIQCPIITLSPPYEVLNINLPVGDYTFYFAVDNNADGVPNATWVDSVGVHVE